MIILFFLLILLWVFKPWKWDKKSTKEWIPEEGLRRHRTNWKGLP